VVGGLTTWGRQSNRPGQSEQFLLVVAFPCCIAAFVQGECALAHGELAYVQGELSVVFELWFVQGTRWPVGSSAGRMVA
jgi:hypothetical protein